MIPIQNSTYWLSTKGEIWQKQNTEDTSTTGKPGGGGITLSVAWPLGLYSYTRLKHRERQMSIHINLLK